MESTTQPRTRLSGEQRRDLVFASAARLFGERGYDGTRIEEIAEAAGVTKPIVYRHFASKKALYLALLEKHRADLPTFFAAGTGVDGGPEDVFRAILDGWLDYVRANSHGWLMLFRDSSGDAEIRSCRIEVSSRAREVLAAFVADQAGGSVAPEQVEPTAELLTSGLAGLALWWIERPDVPKDVVLEVAARAATASLTGQPARR